MRILQKCMISGNDYVSSFFRNGKIICYKVLESKAKFQRAFAKLGMTWEISEDVVSDLKHFLCQVYGCRAKDVNSARYEMFSKKYTKGDEVIDMALLIPCKTVFMLHLQRANYYAALLKMSLSQDIDAPQPTSHG